MLKLTIIALIFFKGASCSCASSGYVTAPVQDVVLSNGRAMRGISIGAGFPRQNFSMLPLPYFNDTWIYNSSTNLCDWSTSAGCVSYRGGLYDTTVSKTSKDAEDAYAAGADPRDTMPLMRQNSPFSAWVNDDVLVGDVTLEGHPIGMPGTSLYEAYDNQAGLGLGHNSTVLNALLAMNKIASRSYSFWWGLTGATETAHMDGHIVLGGYDAAKIQGSNSTMALTAPTMACHSSMTVMISDISLGFPNGSVVSITSPNAVIACVVPHYPLIATLPMVPFYDNFEAHTGTKNVGRGGGTGIDFGGMLYWPNEVYQGELIITLDSGFQATFPNELLVVPPSDVRDNGAVYMNQTVREVLISPTEGGNSHDWAILGRHFFQSAYLTVDFDANTFTLSQANRTTDSRIVALGPDCSTPAVKIPTANPKNTTGSAHHSSSDSSDDSSDRGLTTGALVGAVVGGVCCMLAIFAGAAMYILRRRRKRANRMEPQSNMSDFAHQHGHMGYPEPFERLPPHAVEMQTDNDPHEMMVETRALELSNDKAGAVRQKRLLQGRNSPVELDSGGFE